MDIKWERVESGYYAAYVDGATYAMATVVRPAYRSAWQVMVGAGSDARYVGHRSLLRKAKGLAENVLLMVGRTP